MLFFLLPHHKLTKNSYKYMLLIPDGPIIRRGYRFIVIARYSGFSLSRHYLPPVCAEVRLSSTWSREKLPTFWLGGDSLKVEIYWPIYSCAGTNMKTRSSLQWS